MGNKKENIEKLEEKFRSAFPSSVTMPMACLCDKEVRDNCVLDYNSPKSCIHAQPITKKENCKFWFVQNKNMTYSPDDIWNWIKNNIT